MSFQPSVAIVNVHNQKRIAVAVETPATTKRNVTVPSKFFTLRLNPWLVVSSSLYKGFLRFLTADDVISKWGWGLPYDIPLYEPLRISLNEMKQLLDFFGAPFVYRSPVGLQGFRAGLMQLSNRQLQPLADTQSHVKKTVLVDRIIASMK